MGCSRGPLLGYAGVVLTGDRGPRRVALALRWLLVVGGAGAVSVVPVAQAAGVQPFAKPTPIRAVPPPARVAGVLAKTEGARVIVLRESSQGGTSRYVVDNRHDRAETWAGSAVSLIQLGSKVYAPAAKGGCFHVTRRASSLLPNVGGMLLPSGEAGLSYKVAARTIRWSIKTAAKYSPHGVVRVNATGRIVRATVYSGPGVPLTATVSYPANAPGIKAPAKLC